MFKTATDIVLFVVAVFAVIGGFYKAYIEFDKKKKALRKKRDGFFTGNWSNEGQIIKNRPTHYVDLSLACAERKLQGSFNIRKSDDPDGWVKVSLTGKRHSYSSKCDVTYLVNEEVVNSAKILLTKNKEGKLEWKLVEGKPDFFPSAVVLCRSLPVVA